MKIIIPFLLVLTLYSCKAQKITLPQEKPQEVNIDYKLLPGYTYKLTNSMKMRTENIAEGNLDSLAKTQPSGLLAMFNTTSDNNSIDIKTMLTSLQDGGISLTITTDSVNIETLSPFLDEMDNQFSSKLKEATDQQLNETAYGRSIDRKEIIIDSVSGDADPIYGASMLHIKGATVWHGQKQLPSGSMKVGDTYSWKKPQRERSQREKSKKKRRELTKEQIEKLDPEKLKAYESMMAMGEALDNRKEDHYINYTLTKIEGGIAHFDFIEDERGSAGAIIIMASASHGKLEYDIKNHCYRRFEKQGESSITTNENQLKTVNKISSEQVWTIEVKEN